MKEFFASRRHQGLAQLLAGSKSGLHLLINSMALMSLCRLNRILAQANLDKTILDSMQFFDFSPSCLNYRNCTSARDDRSGWLYAIEQTSSQPVAGKRLGLATLVAKKVN